MLNVDQHNTNAKKQNIPMTPEVMLVLLRRLEHDVPLHFLSHTHANQFVNILPSSMLSVLRHCWLGDRKGIWPVNKLGVGLLVVTF